MACCTTSEEVPVEEEPHQPRTYNFPKRSFGKKTITLRSFQPDWFSKWPFIHYDEAKDAALSAFWP